MSKFESILNLITSALTVSASTYNNIQEQKAEQDRYDNLNSLYGYQYNPDITLLKQENEYLKSNLLNANAIITSKSNTIQQLLSERKAEQTQLEALKSENLQLKELLAKAQEYMLQQTPITSVNAE